MADRERYTLSSSELIEKFGALQVQLQAAETHLGYLLQLAQAAWRQEPGGHITDTHYTSEGIQCDVWLPVDKKTYRVTIKEVRQ